VNPIAIVRDAIQAMSGATGISAKYVARQRNS
jgi:hypothetical protein